MHPTLFLLSFRLPQPGSNFVQYKFRNIMDLSDITRLISSLRAQTARDSITPNGLGSILQRIVDAISSMSGIDVEDEAAILQRLSAAESNASTALQTAQNAQAGAAGNVIDSFTQSQDEDEVSLSIKQHGHSARQVVLPAASSTGAGIMTATDKSHLDTAYGKRVNLMSAPSSESVVTLTITFGDDTTKSVTFVGATAGTGGKAGMMTKEQADQLAALVAAGPAESVRDDAGYLKQQYAAPIILRNVTDTVFDDLAIGDVYYDSGHLFYHAEGASGDPDIGAPSRKVIYYCLADQTLYRWTGSRFVQAVSISSGDVTVPTKLSDLINDMGFLTAHQPLKTINGETITGTGNITIDGAAELKDASNHIKQNSATPVVLRNVAETMLDDLNEGDVYFDSGHLFWHTESSSGDIDLGAPSKRLVYFCLGNSNFYRWGGSSFTKINMPAGADGTTPHIDPTTGNWFIGTTNTGIHAQGPKGNSVADGDTFEIVNNLTEGGEGNALSAEMGKRLKAKIEEVNDNIKRLYNNLGNIAFWDAASKANAAPSELDWGNPKHNVTLDLTLANAVVTHNGTEKSSGSVIQVEEGAKLTLIVAPAPNYALSGAPTASVGGSAITPTDNGNGTYTIELTMAQSDVTLAISATGAATYSIGYTLSNCTATTRPTSVGAGGSATIVLEADSGYTLPSSLPSGAVTGASVTSWDAATGTLVIGNVTGNVAISLELTDGYITNGLAFHLDGLNKGTNPNAWTDKVGGVVFTNDGATSIAKGWSFDGISGALYNDDSLSFPNSSCTIEVVFKSNGGDSTRALFHQKTNRGIGLGIFPYNSRKLITNICTAQTDGFVSFASNEAHGVFTGVISTHNSKMLINGVEASTDGGSSLTTNAKNSVGGRYGTSWVGLFNGEIYDIRIYNRQLSPEEMLQNLAVDNQRYELGLTLNT